MEIYFLSVNSTNFSTFFWVKFDQVFVSKNEKKFIWLCYLLRKPLTQFILFNIPWLT